MVVGGEFVPGVAHETCIAEAPPVEQRPDGQLQLFTVPPPRKSRDIFVSAPKPPFSDKEEVPYLSGQGEGERVIVLVLARHLVLKLYSYSVLVLLFRIIPTKTFKKMTK